MEQAIKLVVAREQTICGFNPAFTEALLKKAQQMLTEKTLYKNQDSDERYVKVLPLGVCVLNHLRAQIKFTDIEFSHEEPAARAEIHSILTCAKELLKALEQ